nr:MAG TPA: hypothetical protein [Caudoviricetes sp.]
MLNPLPNEPTPFTFDDPSDTQLSPIAHPKTNLKRVPFSKTDFSLIDLSTSIEN